MNATYCNRYLHNGRCAYFYTETVTVSYTPEYEYSGEQCMSSLLEIYGPVFLGFILLSAIFSFAMDIMVWKDIIHFLRRQKSTYIVRVLRRVVHYLCEERVLMRETGSLSSARRNRAAGRVAKQGFQTLLITLSISLTFGLAVPLVGVAAAISALISRVQYSHLMQSIAIDCPSSISVDLLGCATIRGWCNVLVGISMFMFWVFASFMYLNYGMIGGSAFGAFFMVSGLSLLYEHLLASRSAAQSEVAIRKPTENHALFAL